MSLSQHAPGVWVGTPGLGVGELTRRWREWQTEVIIGHPTFANERTIGKLVREGVRAGPRSFPGRSLCVVVSDGTQTARSADTSTRDAALAAAVAGLADLPAELRRQVRVIVTPYDGHDGNHIPGKGSALKLIFDEMDGTSVALLVLLDGDLRNDVGEWQRVFAAVERDCAARFPGRSLFVTARYARHFVDASLTRFVVGPLTTLMGCYVPGGISGDIALSAGAVAHERAGDWTEARRKYGTDISTTFDNIGDPNTVIYEVYLGAKLHDITDEAKLSVMPGEVIGAALERLLCWERLERRVTRRLSGENALREPVIWGAGKTGIGFVDPGATDAFDVDVKIEALLGSFARFTGAIRRVQGEEVLGSLERHHRELARLERDGDGELRFLGIDEKRWIEMLQRAVSHLLVSEQIDDTKQCLNYLYAAAFLEFVKDRLADLGLRTLSQIRAVQGHLCVESDRAEAFYDQRVDAVARRLALEFHASRGRIAEMIAGYEG